jgi:mannose-6-phosphate isomerase-like protein (cupin superfamily)
MNSKILPAFLTLILCGSAIASDRSKQTGVVLINHEKVAQAVAKGGPLLITNNFKVQTGHRTGPGEVEIHDEDTDIFYILEGSATFVTGGKASGTKKTGPGETRGKEIKGGEEHRLTKGDVIVIPKRVPHWFKEVNGPFDYFVVKVKK